MSRFANLGRRLAAVEPENPEVEDEDCPSDQPQKSKKKDQPMSDQNEQALADAEKKGHDTGFKAANERMNKVFASEHYAGREALAATMLAKPSMSADDIIDILAATPKAEKQGLSDDASREAAEAAGRKEMKDALAQTGNSGIDATNGGSGGDDDAKAKASNYGWDAIHAEVEARRGSFA